MNGEQDKIDMLTLSEEIRKHGGTHGILVRKIPPKKKFNSEKEFNKTCIVISFGIDILIRANLREVKRIDAFLENESLKFFEPLLPGAGWAFSRPGRSEKLYFRIPYREGLPFVLNDNERHKLKELAVDFENKTITVATSIEENIDA